MPVYEGTLIDREIAVDGKGHYVTLEFSAASKIMYYVPLSASFVRARSGSGCSLDFEDDFEASRNRPARVELDNQNRVVKFRTEGNSGYTEMRPDCD